MTEQVDENHLIEERRKKLLALKEKTNAYPNNFRRDSLADDLLKSFGEEKKEDLEKKEISVSVAGRVMLRRIMGKASFCTIQDMSGRIQLYLRGDELDNYEDFKDWDIGDIVGASGKLFKTNTGELSVHLEKISLLTKSLRPLPEKHAGLSDIEIRYRKRYLDLLTNEESLNVFKLRSSIISNIRNYLISDNFIEVETPMMHSIPGGATARPFVTHHNSLDMDLYLRVAPELYLKRLVIGGMEKVFEINRNFRNEGLSTRHNPEFTMLEFYTAYVDVNYQMKFVENMLRDIEKKIGTETKIFEKDFIKLSMDEAIINYTDLSKGDLLDLEKLISFSNNSKIKVEKNSVIGILKAEIFDTLVEKKLLNPTFIYDYPIEISPLSRSSDEDELIAERFELFVNGRELGNAFSELNDPSEQSNRFRTQSEKKESGDQEAMHFDGDYIEALEYGLAPCAGVGIGIDRLVMLLTGTESIRDVLLFPQLKNK
jgi:lysyl-tRNA synthetase class 2